MIPDDKKWILKKLGYLKEDCVKVNGESTKMHNYDGRIKLLDKLIEFVAVGRMDESINNYKHEVKRVIDNTWLVKGMKLSNKLTIILNQFRTNIKKELGLYD